MLEDIEEGEHKRLLDVRMHALVGDIALYNRKTTATAKLHLPRIRLDAHGIESHFLGREHDLAGSATDVDPCAARCDVRSSVGNLRTRNLFDASQEKFLVHIHG